jgi:hypothetical protein
LAFIIGFYHLHNPFRGVKKLIHRRDAETAERKALNDSRKDREEAEKPFE